MNTHNTGVVLIDGPTGSGKTQYIKRLGATPSNTLTSEQLMDILLQMCREMCQGEFSLEETAFNLGHIAYVENMEDLAGRPETQRLAAKLVALMASKHCVTLTGIDFPNRLPFLLETLDEQKTNCVWKSKLIEDEI